MSHALKQRLPEYVVDSAWYPKYDKNPRYWHEIHLSLSEKDLKRWKLAANAFLKEIEILGVCDTDDGRYRNFEIAQLPILPSSMPKTIEPWPQYESLLARRRANLGGTSWVDSSLLLTLWLLGALYGGIHLALWNYDFPTRAETSLWRISAATLFSMAVFCLLVALLVRAPIEFDIHTERRRTQESHGNDAFQPGPPCPRHIVWLIRAAVAAPILLYILARIFIVVESFISLRHVPIGVYEGGLGWSKYIPHL